MKIAKARPVKQILMDCSDEDVRQRVSRFLFSQHFPAFRNLEIDVNRGAVTLTGEVQSYYEKQIAMTSRQRVVGVVCLVDEIRVTRQQEAEQSDLHIEF